LYYHTDRIDPGKEPPTYEQLTRSMEIARRKISISYSTRNDHEEQVKIDTVLKYAASIIGTEADGRIARMMEPWRITRKQVVGKIDRRVFQKLKKLKAFS
jgi:sugar/nucleoside kinase (ribokinase family)